MFDKFGKNLVSKDLIEAVKKVMDQPDGNDQTEELKGGQVKLDKNHNGKLDSQDFKMLRGEKKVNEQGVAEGSNYDELNARPGMWRGKADMAKRMTKKGEPTKAEKDFQDNLKNRIKASNRQGGLTGPKGVLPEEQGVAEDNVNEAEADYQSSYRVGKTANFKPKVSDVGQGRKITGKMGKYGKQPDDDEKMVEPPKDQTVGDVKTDPSSIVPGHSTMGAKLHLASLPKDKEGNPIHKGARKVSAAELVAKRRAMMAGQKNEDVELDEANSESKKDFEDRQKRLAAAAAQTAKDPARLKRMMSIPGYSAAMALANKTTTKEEVEDTLHPAGAALLKHIKPQHHNLYKPHLTKDVFNGSYGDRTSVLKAAKDAGHLKMDLKKQNEAVESITEGKMDKMTLSGLWHRHAQHSYMSDQGYGHGERSMENNEHAATAIENHVRKHYGNKVADDMVSHSDHHVSHAEYAGPESSPHHEKEAEKLRKKHGIHGDLYGESVSHVTERVDPSVRTTDTLKGRVAGGEPNQHSSYKVKLETKGVGAMDRIKSAAKTAFNRVKNETMMGKAGATSEAKKLDKEGY